MREVDLEPIRAALVARSERAARETERFRRIENWRERLISEGEVALEELAHWYPAIDVSAWRQRIGAARAEHASAEAARVPHPASCFAPCAQCSLQCRDETARRHHHGLVVRLGDDAGGGGAVRPTLDPLRGARRLGAPHP